MIKQTSFAVGLFCMGILLSGCASDYVISTNDGHMITTHGKPEKDKSTGLISYQDNNGTHYQINQREVKEIVEK